MRRSPRREPPPAKPSVPAVAAVADGACRKVRSGFGVGWACRTHGRAWPCDVRRQAAEQLSMLHRASPLAPPVLLEVAAERLRQLEDHPTRADDEKPAHYWTELLVEYLNRANTDALLVREALEAGAVPDLAAWRHRLIQLAAIAAAGAESCDRVTGSLHTTEETR